MAVAPNTNINIPYSPFLNEQTGRPNTEWLQWLMNPSFITLNLGSALPVTSGGTGLTTIPTNGQLLIGNGTGYTLNPLTPGVGIGVTNGAGLITVANTGVLSNIAGTGISVSNPTGNVTIGNTGVLSWSGGSTGLTPATATTGVVTLAGTLGAGYGGTGLNTYVIGDLLYASGTTAFSRLADIATGNALISGGIATAPSWGKIGLTTHVSGTLPIGNGGTNGTATATAGAVAYGTGTAYAFTAAGTLGQVLTSAGAGTPTWAAAATGTVTSVAALTLGTTGTDLSSIVANGTTTPVITLQVPTASASNRGALSAADWTTFNNKGSGTVTSVTGTAPVVSSGGTTPAISMAAATTSVNGYLTSTDWTTFNNKGSGSVTSVAASVPAFLSISGSPITTSGTLAITLSGTALPVLNGGTGVTTSTGTGNTVLSAAPTLSGNVTLSTDNLVIGTAGKGIDFSITSHLAGMTSELLADYEEGTWTPVGTWATQGSGTSSNGGAANYYTKVGRTVTLLMYIIANKGTASGTFTVTGVPYAPATSAACACRIDGMGSALTVVAANITSTTMNFSLMNQSTTYATSVTAAAMATDCYIQVTCTYSI